MRLYWVRHGQMEFRAHRISDFRTVNRLFNQETEGALSPRGRREAEAVASHFRGRALDAVYASPLIRAKETAEHTARALELETRVIPEIGEIRTGHLPDDSIAASILSGVTGAGWLPRPAKRILLGFTLIPLYFYSWRSRRTVGGETPDDLEARLADCFARLRRDHERGARVALFAHGYVIFYLCAFLARGAGLDPWRRPYIPNGSVTEMELGPVGPPQLVSFAQTAHLQGGRVGG